MNNDIDNITDTAIQLAANQGQELVNKEYAELWKKAKDFKEAYDVYESKFSQEKYYTLSKSLKEVKKKGDIVEAERIQKIMQNQLIQFQLVYKKAFEFDEALTRYRGKQSKSVLFVYETSEEDITTYEVSFADAADVITIGGKFNKYLPPALKKTVEEEQENQKHVITIKRAYYGAKNRLEAYFEIANNKDSKQGGLLLYKLNSKWQKAFVLNYGDLKEAYINALFTEHDTKILCNMSVGNQPYYDHLFIGKFFDEFIAKVDSGAAIISEDVITGKKQYAVKGIDATAPKIKQYYSFALKILNNPEGLDKERIEKLLLQSVKKAGIRNKIVEITDQLTNAQYRRLTTKLSHPKRNVVFFDNS